MSTQDIENLIARSINLGQMMTRQMYFPHEDKLTRKQVVSMLRIQGYSEKDLRHWEEMKLVHPVSKGERSARKYSLVELTKVMLMKESQSFID